MSFTSLFLFFFGAIGVFNSFLVSLYFIFKKGKLKSNLLFGLFLFFISERALRSLIYFFSSALPNPYSKSDAVTFMFIGPFLFLYVISVINPGSKLVNLWRYHGLFWAIITTIALFKFPFLEDPIFWKKYILTGINLQWLIYILVSLILLINKLYYSKSNTEKYNVTNHWLLLLIASVLVLWCIYFFISFSYFVVGSIAFSLIFYAFYLYFIFNKKHLTTIFTIQKRYVSKRFDNESSEVLIQELQALMQEEKPFKNPNLRLKDLAQKLDMTVHQLSQLLNNSLGKKFSEFVNEYRIEEAKQLIQENTKYTLDAIGNESGFNSKSTFYSYFKRIVGMTPKAYREGFLST